MRVCLDSGSVPWSGPPHLPSITLLAETDTDRRVLDRLIAKFECLGFGRHPETGDPLHLTLEIRHVPEQRSAGGTAAEHDEST